MKPSNIIGYFLLKNTLWAQIRYKLDDFWFKRNAGIIFWKTSTEIFQCLSILEKRICSCRSD